MPMIIVPFIPSCFRRFKGLHVSGADRLLAFKPQAGLRPQSQNKAIEDLKRDHA
ncbi:hypothetical protein [Vibrio renipiscarius]|uniref:hypothetical protein n=1 Tax=Vibrio renipiscarius TaxID=1461322 RepID=UPI0013635B53|nr:hypothetical protein [Vibrio renipiscarius]